MAIRNTYVTLTNVIALNVIHRNHVRAFSTWHTHTGSSNISPSMALSRVV